MPLPAEVAELQTQTGLRLRALRDTARTLAPASRQSVPARFLLNLCKAAIVGLGTQLDSVDPADDPGDVQLMLQGVLRCAALIHLLLAFVSEPTLGRVSQAMGPPLERLARSVVKRSRMLIYYDWRPSNYSFRREFPVRLRRVLLQALTEDVEVPEEQWPPAAKVVPPVFAVLSLPASERENTLLHSTLAHEVGHALAEQRDFDAPPLPTHLEGDEAKRIVWNWQEELLADAWGIFLLGPAPLLSLMELSRHDAASDTHPCNHLRFTLMADCLRKNGFLDAAKPPVDLEWLSQHVDKALGRAACSQPSEEENSHFAQAHSHLHAQRGAMVDFVFGHPGAYRRATWDSEVSAEDGRHVLVSRILHCAPPDCVEPDMSQPHLGSILNAGWAVRRHPRTWKSFSSQFPADERHPEYGPLKRLNQLLLKAIEITSMRQAWREVSS